jgi:multiple antibiotic resistance protein
MRHALELFTVFVIQLFIIVDPIAGIPVFLAITPNKTVAERRTMARRSCTIACTVIIFFLAVGVHILAYFGIDISAVRVCGGVLLFIISLELLYGHATGTGTSSREERLAEVKPDVSVTPLAIPLLAGPGAIATCIIFAGRARSAIDYGILIAGAIIVFTITYFFLHWADRLHGIIGVLGMTVATRIMGLLLSFIAVQYVINGVQILMQHGGLP